MKPNNFIFIFSDEETDIFSETVLEIFKNHKKNDRLVFVIDNF